MLITCYLSVLFLSWTLYALDVKRHRKSKWDQHVTQDSRPSSKGNSPEPKVGAQALANAAQLNVELNKLGHR